MQNDPEEIRSEESESISDSELAKTRAPAIPFSWFVMAGFVVIILSPIIGLMFTSGWIAFHGLFYGFILIGIGQIKEKLHEIFNK